MKRDITEKRLEGCNDVFADIFDNLLFEGRNVVQEGQLKALPTEAFVRDMGGTLRQGNRDIRKADCRGGRYYLICGMENQSDCDNTMPERTMGYDYAAYEEQIRELMEKNRREGVPAYTKRIHYDQRLAPVITIVLYYGAEPWERPVCLHDMLEFPAEHKDILKRYTADYPINLIQVAYLTKEARERLTSDFRLIADYLSCQNDRQKLSEFMENMVPVRHPEEFLDTMKAITKDKRYERIEEKLTMENKEPGGFNMCVMAEMLEQIGIEKGIERGIEKGIEKGEMLKLIQMVCRKLQKGKKPEMIAEELEEDQALIGRICEAALKSASEYDCTRIYEHLKEEKT